MYTGAQVQQLKSERTTDPEGIGYSGLSDDDFLAKVKDATRSVLRPVPLHKIIQWAAKNGSLDRLQQATTGGATEAIRAAAIGAVSLINSPHATPLDLKDSEITGMFGALVSAGVFTGGEQTDFMANVAKELQSRLTEIGLPSAQMGDVIQAAM